MAGKRKQQVIIRARKRDLPELGRLARAYFEELGLEYDARGLDRDMADPERVYEGGGILVALEGDKAVGMVGLRMLEPGTGEIKRMYLCPAHRGAGLGRRLLQVAIDLARELGLARLVLDTRLELKAANALYESFGFRDIEDYNQNPRAQRFMELELSA